MKKRHEKKAAAGNVKKQKGAPASKSYAVKTVKGAELKKSPKTLLKEQQEADYVAQRFKRQIEKEEEEMRAREEKAASGSYYKGKKSGDYDKTGGRKEQRSYEKRSWEKEKPYMGEKKYPKEENAPSYKRYGQRDDKPKTEVFKRERSIEKPSFTNRKPDDGFKKRTYQRQVDEEQRFAEPKRIVRPAKKEETKTKVRKYGDEQPTYERPRYTDHKTPKTITIKKQAPETGNKYADKKGTFSEKRWEDNRTFTPKRQENTDKYTTRNEETRYSKRPVVIKRRVASVTQAPLSALEELRSGGMRLNKYVANSGVCSRRQADELIASGKVTVNGQVILAMGHHVFENDVVLFEGKKLNPAPLVYVLLNKPKNIITTARDPEGRPTVMDLVKGATPERLYPVGRLDRNTTGLLILTNDGELAQQLSHPSSEIPKIYYVILNKPLLKQDLDKIAQGKVELEDGLAQVDEIEYVSSLDRSEIGVNIHSGRNRIVRRIFEHLGYEVMRLDRIMYAGLTKKDLARGKWRYLSPREVAELKRFKSAKPIALSTDDED
ncbi:MAG TPA: pseudouridine synthase [Chitinophagales bacterium]|nr:pseudouridine synthase [Chitinophagales bacterium]